MNLTTAVLGATAVERLTAAASEHVVVIGSDTLTRGELSRVGCYNFVAAKNLSKILRALKMKNLREIFEQLPPSALALPHMGVISLAVLGACFEAKRIGGGSPLEAYVRRHAPEGANGVKRAMVTFDTIKRRDAAEQAGERKARKRRKAARRDEAQKIRVERFEEKAATA